MRLARAPQRSIGGRPPTAPSWPDGGTYLPPLLSSPPQKGLDHTLCLSDQVVKCPYRTCLFSLSRPVDLWSEAGWSGVAPLSSLTSGLHKGRFRRRRRQPVRGRPVTVFAGP